MEIRRIKCRATGEQLIITKPENIRRIDAGEQLSIRDITHEKDFHYTGSVVGLDGAQ